MSLNWNVANVANFEVVTTSPFNDKKWHPVTDALVWLSMACGFNKITEANLEDVTRRIGAFQTAVGPYLSDPDKGIYVTPDDVKMHIGLSTNASSKTKAKFIKELGELEWDRYTPHHKQGKSAYEICAENAVKFKSEQAKEEAV